MKLHKVAHTVYKTQYHMVIPPKYSVSFAVETIKKNTSRALREKFRFLEKVYWDRDGI